ncbi:phosphoribosyl-ATP diphosphatase [Hyphomonas sp. FCG-A18]|uniref:phosphoribosyl-ATP diphosphatase n=1 Tax=Hyphomonas sp. FCG-A18 TaxID=3080019 RepID=UPI002B2839F5|nr:phosphoribosyl-ATP diphosphatase [Hyphomonas sp. FCG-A18]
MTTPLGPATDLAQALAYLAETVDERAEGNSETSYTAKLLSKGSLHCGKKIAEEGAELALALAAQGEAESAAEAADLIYHMLVGLRSKGVTLDDVAAALMKRQGMSGLAEKAARPD